MSGIITKGSLCTGTGGLDALLPGSLSWLAETGDVPSLLLKREHPDVPNLGDITAGDFGGTHVDLLTSGDPCQSMSVAGRQNASEDERFLWPHVIDVIDKVKPRQVFLENVQNVTSVALVKGADDWRGQKGSVLAMRLSDLRAIGYACRWTVLGACAIGACHHRHRWFLRGWWVGSGAPKAERVVLKCGAPRSGRRVLLPSPVARDADGRGEGSPEYWARRAEHRSNGMPLGAAVALLPSPTTADGSGGPGTSPSRTGGMNLRTAVHHLMPTPRATDGTNGGPNQRGRRGDLAMGSAVQAEHWGKFAPAVALWADAFGALPPEPTEPAPKGGRRLNASLSEWMMGYPAGFLTDGFARNDALKMAGNGAMAVQARAAWDLLDNAQNKEN
jgi:DNA (cytosine-5)-methyltransferase 1